MPRARAATLWAPLERTVQEQPDHVLLADDHGRRLTVRQFHDRALITAAGLQDLGIGRQHVVSWQLPTTLEAAVVMAALSRLGVVQNPLIPALRRSEVDFITTEVHARWLIVPERHRKFDYVGMAHELSAQRDLRVLVIGPPSEDLTGSPLPSGDPTAIRSVRPEAREVRWLFYSSGTSATPKGAKHSDATVIAAAEGLLAARNITPGDVYPIAFPIGHIGGVVLLIAAIRARAQLVLFGNFDPLHSPLSMATHRPTILGSAGAFLSAYVDAQRHVPETLFPNLRICMSGGAEIRPNLARAVKETLGGAGVVASYGLTEFPMATLATPEDTAGPAADAVGRPAPGVQARVCGADGSELGRGQSGELQLRGPQRCIGYVDSALERDAFTSDGWLRTGDIATIDGGGYVRIVGRLKDIIIRKGENISAAEVEEALVTNPAVVDVAVLGLPDEQSGERVCAVVVLRPETTLSLADLVAHVRRSGLALQKCPEQLEIVDALPRNAMGKVVKRDLVAPRRIHAAQVRERRTVT